MPIRFEIYRDGNRVTTFDPVAATAIGPESVPIGGEVFFRDGLLIVNRKDEHASGVSLQWECGPMGCFLMETTRLQPREKPYNLNVELARFRLMKIMQKQEDWNLFDFPKADKFSGRLQEANNFFADALGMLDRPGEASKLADRALEMGVDLSEQLALFHADLLLAQSKSGQWVCSPCLRRPGQSDHPQRALQGAGGDAVRLRGAADTVEAAHAAGA